MKDRIEEALRKRILYIGDNPPQAATEGRKCVQVYDGCPTPSTPTSTFDAAARFEQLREPPQTNREIWEMMADFAEEYAAAREAQARKEWISVETGWPPRHQNVLCLNRDGSIFEGRICVGMHAPFFTYPRGDGNPSNTCPAWIDVTHWMPLPEPPRVAEEKK